jgi:hypothetical protein
MSLNSVYEGQFDVNKTHKQLNLLNRKHFPALRDVDYITLLLCNVTYMNKYISTCLSDRIHPSGRVSVLKWIFFIR